MNIHFDNGGTPLGDIALACNGSLLLGESRNVRGISTDSRKINKDDLFICIRGERFDGHDFAAHAIEAGAAGVLCERIPEGMGENSNIILTDNTVRAFGRLAKAYKDSIAPLTVAVTGSVGKTTTRQFIYSVLCRKYNTHKTEGNFNNEIGLPISLLALRRESEAAVFELGMSARGEIEYLSGLASPDIAVITSIGTSHIEFLGSRENIRDAKLEIVKGLKPSGKLVLNGDEPLLSGIPGAHYVAIDNQNAEFVVSNIRTGGLGTLFDLRYPDGTEEGLEIPGLGTHIVLDAAIAFAVGYYAGVRVKDIRIGLAAFVGTGMRQNIRECGGVTFISDYYNASPESMSASLEVLKDAAKRSGGRAVAVLGDMYELGAFTKELHLRVGKKVAELGIDMLFTFGKNASWIADGAEAAGMSAGAIFRFTDLSNPSSFGSCVALALRSNDTVLIKASRSVRMERIIEYISEDL